MSENRLKIGIVQGGGSVFAKCSRRRRTLEEDVLHQSLLHGQIGQ